MRPGGQGYCSVANAENVAALSGDTALPDRLNRLAGMPNKSVFDYCASYERWLDVCLFARMFPDGRNRTTVDHRGMHCDTDIGAWKQRWSSMRQQCAEIISLAGMFGTQFIHYGDEIVCIRLLHALFRK